MNFKEYKKEFIEKVREQVEKKADHLGNIDYMIVWNILEDVDRGIK